MQTRRALTIALMLLAMGASTSAQDLAHDWPRQPVKIIVPLQAGSVTDILARMLSDRLQRTWGQPVIVENRPGIPGTASVAKAPGDGYTLLMTSNGHAVLGAMNKSLPFDPLGDFVGVTQVASVPFVLVVSPGFEAKNLVELIAAAKARPGKLNIASPGLGTSVHILSELFKRAAGIDVVTVPYKGAPDAHTSVLRGDSQMFFSAANIAVEYIAGGKVRPLAIVARARHPKLPEVVTMAEAGLPGLDYDAWFGVLAPSGTPAAVVERIGKDIAATIAEPDVQTAYERQGLAAVVAGPARFDRMLREDTERFSRLFRDLNLGQN